MVKRLPTMRETQDQSLGWEDLLEKEIATHSSTLARKIPWTEEPSRLQSVRSQRVGPHLPGWLPHFHGGLAHFSLAFSVRATQVTGQYIGKCTHLSHRPPYPSSPLSCPTLSFSYNTYHLTDSVIYFFALFVLISVLPHSSQLQSPWS